MVKKKYIFPYVEKGTPFYSYAVTSKSLLERLDEVYASFERFSDTSNSQTPQHLLYLMLQHNESLLELSEYAMEPDPDPDSTSPTIKSRPESSISERKSLKRKHLSLDESAKSKSLDTGSSSSQKTASDSPPKTKSKRLDTGSSSSQKTSSDSPPKEGSSTISNVGSTLRSLADFVPTREGQTPSISGVKRKRLSVDESPKSERFDSGSSSSHQTVSDSPPKEGSSTISKPTGLFLASEVQPQESTRTETSNLTTAIGEFLRDFFKDINPTTDVQEDVSLSDNAEMAKKADSKSPSEEFKVPALPVQDKKGTSTSKPTDLVPTAQVQPQESTSTETVREFFIDFFEDINPTTDVQEDISLSDNAEMTKADSKSPAEEFKVPALPVQDKKGTSVSKPTDLVPTSQVQSQESTSTETSNLTATVRELSSPIKKPKEDISPTCVQEYASTSDEAEMSKKTDAKSPFKIPEIPIKYRKEVSKPTKRPAESGSSPTRQFLSPSKKSKTEEMDISPHKSPPAKRPTSMSWNPGREFVSPSKKGETSGIQSKEVSVSSIVRGTIDAVFCSPMKDDGTDILSTSDEKASDIPTKECRAVVVSKDKIESATQTPPIKDDGIEIDMLSTSDEQPGPSHRLAAAEMEMFFDDPSRVDSIKEAVEERIKVSISLKKTKGDISPSEKKSPRRSPRKSKKIGSPGKNIKTTSLPDLEKVSPSILSHPNVMSYLKLRFKSILSNRNNCLLQIYGYFDQFYSDVGYLFYYSNNIFTLAENIPVEGQVYFNRDVANWRRRLVRNARRITNHLRPFADAARVGRPFWVQNLNEIKRLNEQNAHLLSVQSSTQTTVELLREYESKLRVIWRRMDRRVLETDGMRLSMVEISADFKQLIKDFGKYLVMIELMKPFSVASSEENRSRLRISWH